MAKGKRKIKMKITIFTATYNRANLLPRLYETLLIQNNQDFEWLIVDDGSTDETKVLVKEWQKRADFLIRYIYQNNMGKWKAFNNGVKVAQGELFFCVDSDDWLTPNAIDNILAFWEQNNDDVDLISENKILGGLIAKKQDMNGNVLSAPFPIDIKSVDTYTLTEKYMCTGEFALIYKTDILCRFPFPELKEKFITERVVYDRIAEIAQLLIFDEVVNLCEYQSDGLSGNAYKLMIDNPTGYQIYYLQRASMNEDLYSIFGDLLRHHAFRRLSKNRKFKYMGKHKLLNFVANLFSVSLQHYYKIKMVQENKGE